MSLLAGETAWELTPAGGRTLGGRGPAGGGSGASLPCSGVSQRGAGVTRQLPRGLALCRTAPGATATVTPSVTVTRRFRRRGRWPPPAAASRAARCVPREAPALSPGPACGRAASTRSVTPPRSSAEPGRGLGGPGRTPPRCPPDGGPLSRSSPEAGPSPKAACPRGQPPPLITALGSRTPPPGSPPGWPPNTSAQPHGPAHRPARPEPRTPLRAPGPHREAQTPSPARGKPRGGHPCAQTPHLHHVLPADACAPQGSPEKQGQWGVRDLSLSGRGSGDYGG